MNSKQPKERERRKAVFLGMTVFEIIGLAIVIIGGIAAIIRFDFGLMSVKAEMVELKDQHARDIDMVYQTYTETVNRLRDDIIRNRTENREDFKELRKFMANEGR